MKKHRYLPILWAPRNPSPGVKTYIDAHYEFHPDEIKSDYPYRNRRWKEWFKSFPEGGWKLRQDHIHNCLSADLIAAAECLTSKMDITNYPGMPGGIGAEGACVNIPLLDGSVSVEFLQYEDQYTNKVHASQKTLVTGPLAFRVLLELLGFSGPIGRLKGEKRVPKHPEVVALVTESLAAGKASSDV